LKFLIALQHFCESGKQPCHKTGHIQAGFATTNPCCQCDVLGRCVDQPVTFRRLTVWKHRMWQSLTSSTTSLNQSMTSGSWRCHPSLWVILSASFM